MKKYLIYSVILGFMGYSLLSTASGATLTNKSLSALEQLGE